MSEEVPGEAGLGSGRLHYNLHRYYDPSMGRYLSHDPIGLNGGPNPFDYARANPDNYGYDDGQEYAEGCALNICHVGFLAILFECSKTVSKLARRRLVFDTATE